MSIILMADIIGSRHKEEKRLMNSFAAIVEKVNETSPEKLHSPLTITLGDEFQGVTKSLKSAIELVFELEETLISSSSGFKLRYAVQEGEIKTPINPHSAHGMLGEGLTQGRELLNSMKGSKDRSQFRIRDKEKEEAMNEGSHLTMRIIDSWKEKDQELVAAFWKHRDYKMVAEKLNKDVSLMWRRERSLWLREYEGLKKMLRYIAS